MGQAGTRAIHGFGLASQFYFGESIRDLQTHQIALLVGLVKGPSYYNPRRHPDRALSRRNLVIDVMAETDLISEAGCRQGPCPAAGCYEPGFIL